MKKTHLGNQISRTSYRELFDLKGKTAIVTGGIGILGKEFCRGLAESGANIAVVDVVKDEAVNFAETLSAEYQIKSRGFFCDVSDKVSVELMVQNVVDYFGQINILHNNAAAKSDNLEKYFAPFEEYELDQWKKIMAVNLDGMFLVAQAVGKQMIKQNSGGSIIQTASIYGIMGPDNRIYEGSFYLDRQINTPAVYSASKAAVVGLTKYLSTYWAKHGIRVNTLTPGGTESGQNLIFKEKYAARIPLARMAQASEIVGALLYLASDASSYVTGHNLVVDGGLNAW